MNGLRWANLLLAAVAVIPPAAHVLELPNKLALDGPLWLEIQQSLYRGWGPYVGGPAEIGALATTAVLLSPRLSGAGTRSLMGVALAAYAAMIGVFFAFNAPVNRMVDRWTPDALPGDWADYRLRWEEGHAIAAMLAIIGLVFVIRAALREERMGGAATE